MPCFNRAPLFNVVNINEVSIKLSDIRCPDHPILFTRENLYCGLRTPDSLKSKIGAARDIAFLSAKEVTIVEKLLSV